jgi:hypothetical protein
MAYLSSNTSALLGQASTHAGVFRSGQQSHFIALSSVSFLRITPKGHAIMHDQQPTHLSGSWRTIPVSGSFTMAPEMHTLTQAGSSQWRQFTENVRGPFSSTMLRD